ncbi:MAG: type II secretion system protein, partial [Candidatus Omnitrophica bacterium]|nr:type II secretion system protein [Candidatus Omnitrophota bacterium]
MYRKRKFPTGFTLIEMLIVLIIIGTLASIGIPTYQKIINDQKSRACQSHLQVLNMSLKLYTLDNNALPASLSEVWPKYTGMALAAREEEKKKSKFYCFLSSLKKLGVPFAEAISPDSLPPSYYDNNISILACPADKTKPTATYDAQGRIVSISGVSYGLNEDLVGISSEQLSCLPDILSIVDSERKKVDFTNSGHIEYRHQTGFWKKKNFANAITLG